MRWFYRLQAHLGLSDAEGIAALVVLAAAVAGGAAQQWQASSSPVPADFYAAADAAFVAASQVEAPEDSSGTPLPGDQNPEAAVLFAAAPAPDSAGARDSAADVAEAEVVAAAAPRQRGRKPPPARTNLNTATEADLQRLPRIGPALAGRIVAYRRAHGPFQHPDQITEVRGIGEKTLEKLRPWIFI